MKFFFKTIFTQLLILALNLCILSPAIGSELWSTNSVSLLYGTRFKVPLSNEIDRKRYIVTLDHASRNSWGDLFSFVDITHSIHPGRPNSVYGEFSPRFSIYQILDKNYETRLKEIFITDILIANTLEYGASASGVNQVNYLIGPGLSLKVPAFKVFQLNFYRRFNQRSGNNWQVTPVWILPFSYKKLDFFFDGVADFSTKAHNKEANVHAQIQLRWDAGKTLLKKNKTLYLGTEFKYWKNKFGIAGTHEKVLQALIRVFF